VTNRADGQFVYGYILPSLGDVSNGGQIDFQVQAFIGYYTTVQEWESGWPRQEERLVFTGESSGWSRTKTVTIVGRGNSGDGLSVLPSDQNPPGPTDPSGDQFKDVIAGFSLVDTILLIVVVVLVILSIITTLFYRRKVSL